MENIEIKNLLMNGNPNTHPYQMALQNDCQHVVKEIHENGHYIGTLHSYFFEGVKVYEYMNWSMFN